MLLILAGVSLSAVFSEKGIFSRAEKAGNRYNEAKAREVLETVLLADGQYEKNINPEYNQDDFLDDLIKKEIEGSDVKGDVAVVDGWAFELDRTVPKIGRYLGLAKDLVFPTVEITSGPTLTNNGREAKFTAKATETTKGITKIELWLNGKRIEKETITYETPQTEITKEFTVNKNGKYTIKAYADLMGSEKTIIEGIVPAVSFSPNGSEEWKKEHTTQIIVEETAETITEMKYVWVKDNGENEPADNLFTADCLNNRTVTGGNETMTGQYYLWVMLTIGTGENTSINKYSSNAFNFDNEGPTVILESTPVSETSFTLTATASEEHNGISRYEFYVDDVKVDTKTTTASTATYTWNGTGMTENKKCYVVAYDGLGNPSEKIVINSRTQLYKWEISKLIQPKKWTYEKEQYTNTVVGLGWGKKYYVASIISFDDLSGMFLGEAQILTYEKNDTRFVGKWVCPVDEPFVVYFLNGLQGISYVAGDYFYITEKAKRKLVQDEIWGNKKLEYTHIKDKYTNGEIRNNIKYSYIGIG